VVLGEVISKIEMGVISLGGRELIIRRQGMRKPLSIITLVIFTLMLFSCATFQVNAYKTLSISKTVYDSTMKTAADLYKQGKLTDAQKSKIIKLGNEYMSAHNEAVRAFKKATESGLLDDKKTYIEKLHIASSILSNIVNYLQPYLEEPK